MRGRPRCVRCACRISPLIVTGLPCQAGRALKPISPPEQVRAHVPDALKLKFRLYLSRSVPGAL